MPEISLDLDAEKRAEEAEDYDAFSGISVKHIKSTLQDILQLVRAGGFFDSYTKHNIEHVEEMIGILDWLIPDETAEEMTPADWLMVVLGIYFHDLGLLVTEQEYEARSDTKFEEFCNDVLFTGDEGTDYRARVERLSPENQERFLYQEFVRSKHPTRVANWITGQPSSHLGGDDSLIDEIGELLNALPRKFRRDLGRVCESHHLDDLDDYSKYPVSQPYGNSSDETANVHYCCLLLRAADLLHITKDRAPSVLFRLISPKDPVSQREWAKQQAVSTVRPKPEGEYGDEVDHKGTVQVHAYFTDPEGFFGLTSYLQWAENELLQTHEWAKEANERYGVKHRFPWRKIDKSRIETEGFLQESFQFELDQYSILELLTGHTLYNDTSVVIRELVQNALDATRFQRHKIGDESDYKPQVLIQWDSDARSLSVLDNGTGMTKRIIKDYFLQIGSSRYREAEILEEYPDFSSISRFGIGVLSAFMVADQVQVTTSHSSEDEARRLTLRSVHGEYLVEVFDKGEEAVEDVVPHGTRVDIEVRPSAELDDVLSIARRWVAVPECPVYVEIDDDDPVQVGGESPADLLRETLKRQGTEVSDNQGQPHRGEVRIREKEHGFVRLAFAVQWDDYYQGWDFHRPSGEPKSGLFGIAAEGIRVAPGTPGFMDRAISAIANLEGKAAPKTNVARTGFESSEQWTAALSRIYRTYANHLIEEQERLTEGDFSLTWAVKRTRAQIRALLNAGSIVDGDEFIRQVRRVPTLLAEHEGKRRALATQQISDLDTFWTSVSPLGQYAEGFLRELPQEASLSEIMADISDSVDVYSGRNLVLPNLDFDHFVEREAIDGKEIDVIRIREERRRLELRWVNTDGDGLWRQVDTDLADAIEETGRLPRQFITRRRLTPLILVPTSSDVDVDGRNRFCAIKIGSLMAVLPDTVLADLLNERLDSFDESSGLRRDKLGTELVAILNLVWGPFTRSDFEATAADTPEVADGLLSDVGRRPSSEYDWSGIRELLQSSATEVYQPLEQAKLELLM